VKWVLGLGLLCIVFTTALSLWAQNEVEPEPAVRAALAQPAEPPPQTAELVAPPPTVPAGVDVPVERLAGASSSGFQPRVPFAEKYRHHSDEELPYVLRSLEKRMSEIAFEYMRAELAAGRFETFETQPDVPFKAPKRFESQVECFADIGKPIVKGVIRDRESIPGTEELKAEYKWIRDRIEAARAR